MFLQSAIHRQPLIVLTLVAMFLPLLSNAQAKQNAATADEAALRQTTLTMDKVNRMYQTNEEFNALAKAHPEWKSEMKKDEDSGNDHADQTVDASIQKLSVHPEVVAIIKKNGFTPREYVLTGMALFTAAFAEATAKQNNIDSAKMAEQTNINPANIAFVTQHKTELEAMQKKMADENKSNTSD